MKKGKGENTDSGVVPMAEYLIRLKGVVSKALPKGPINTFPYFTETQLADTFDSPIYFDKVSSTNCHPNDLRVAH